MSYALLKLIFRWIKNAILYEEGWLFAQTNYAFDINLYNLTIKLVDRLLKKSNNAVFNAITVKDFESEKIIIPKHEVMLDFFKTIAS